MASGLLPPVGVVEAVGTVIVAVPDPVIWSVAEALAVDERLGAHQVVLHCSGARGASSLDPLRGRVRGVGSFHPLLSFASSKAAAMLLDSAAFAVDGDAAAVEGARRLVAALGGQVLQIEADDRVLYHAAAATVSNHLVALAAQGAAMFAALGIESSAATAALVPLMRSTLDNLARLGLPDALTGPVSRGDAACVEGHLVALSKMSPREVSAYSAMAARALDVAREQGVATPSALDDIARILLSRRGTVGGETA